MLVAEIEYWQKKVNLLHLRRELPSSYEVNALNIINYFCYVRRRLSWKTKMFIFELRYAQAQRLVFVYVNL